MHIENRKETEIFTDEWHLNFKFDQIGYELVPMPWWPLDRSVFCCTQFEIYIQVCWSFTFVHLWHDLCDYEFWLLVDYVAQEILRKC